MTPKPSDAEQKVRSFGLEPFPAREAPGSSRGRPPTTSERPGPGRWRQAAGPEVSPRSGTGPGGSCLSGPLAILQNNTACSARFTIKHWGAYLCAVEMLVESKLMTCVQRLTGTLRKVGCSQAPHKRCIWEKSPEPTRPERPVCLVRC